MRARTKIGIGFGLTAAAMVPANFLLEDNQAVYAERAVALEACLPAIGTAACQDIIEGELIEPAAVLPAEAGYLYVYTEEQVQGQVDQLREWSESSNIDNNLSLALFGGVATLGFTILSEQSKKANRDLQQQRQKT